MAAPYRLAPARTARARPRRPLAQPGARPRLAGVHRGRDPAKRVDGRDEHDRHHAWRCSASTVPQKLLLVETKRSSQAGHARCRGERRAQRDERGRQQQHARSSAACPASRGRTAWTRPPTQTRARRGRRPRRRSSTGTRWAGLKCGMITRDGHERPGEAPGQSSRPALRRRCPSGRPGPRPRRGPGRPAGPGPRAKARMHASDSSTPMAATVKPWSSLTKTSGSAHHDRRLRRGRGPAPTARRPAAARRRRSRGSRTRSSAAGPRRSRTRTAIAAAGPGPSLSRATRLTTGKTDAAAQQRLREQQRRRGGKDPEERGDAARRSIWKWSPSRLKPGPRMSTIGACSWDVLLDVLGVDAEVPRAGRELQQPEQRDGGVRAEHQRARSPR